MKTTPTPDDLAAALDAVRDQLDAYVDSTGLRGLWFGPTERREPCALHARGSVVVLSPTPGDWSLTVGVDDFWWMLNHGDMHRRPYSEFVDHSPRAVALVTERALTALRARVPVDLPAPYIAAA